MIKYSHGDISFSADAVRNAAPETQREIMEEWFRKNFENPANEMPYHDGEYIFIYGGPYEAEWVLQEEFGDIVPEEHISALAEELLGEGWQWAPVSGGNYYEQGFTDDPHQNFQERIDNIKNLLSGEIRNTHSNVYALFYGLLYVNVIASLEVYLSDFFHAQIQEDESRLRCFVETTPHFKEQKIPLSEIHKTMDDIKKRVDAYLTGFVWHHLDRLEKIYNKTLGIKFSENKHEIINAIRIRHDILHRNGKFRTGEKHKITHQEVQLLISEVQEFVSAIEEPACKTPHL